MTKSSIIAFLVFFQMFSFSESFGQSENSVLTYNQYIENILFYHPISKKANLKLKIADAEILGAKGNLDPIITSDWNQKNFDDKLYYRQYQAKFRLPTLYGVDVVGGYENSEGIYINPEDNTSDFGLWNLGVEVNILQGLIVNERRTALDQAKVYQNLAVNEQKIMLNDLVFDASSAYLTWQQYFYFEKVLEENITLANTYLENTKASYNSGEKTTMDTIEAYVLYQDALVLLQKNEQSLIKSRQELENFLWFDNVPITLQESTEPEDYKNEIFSQDPNFVNLNLSNHPIIESALNKLSYFEIEQKLKREKLKPKLKLKFNPLLATTNNVAPIYSANDYKWGIDFSMPLLYRSERANIQKGQIKLQEIELDIQNKRNELQNKIESSWQQQQLLQNQKILINQNVSSYQKLLEGENEKFKFGESSVFLQNKRQEKYINGQLKLVEVYIYQQFELLNFLYYSNQLIEE